MNRLLRPPRPVPDRAARSLRATAAALVLAVAPARASAGWQIVCDGSDITAACAPIPAGKLPAVNITAIAPVLGVQARVTGNGAVIADAQGNEWRGQNGALALDGTARSLVLSAPLRILGSAVYVPVDSAAQLAALSLSITDDKVVLTRAAPAKEAADKVAEAPGWEGLTIKKTDEEKAREARIYSPTIPGRKPGLANLPPGDRSIDLGFGLGHVVGGDWGNEFSATGKYAGTEVGFGTFLAYGRGGIRPLTSRLILRDEEYGRAGELGDMFSDLWGLTRGVRFSRLAGSDRWQSISLYARNANIGPNNLVAAYRDEVPVNKRLWLGGEVATDKSAFLKARLQSGPFTLYAFHRSSETAIGNGQGAFVTYQLPARASFYGTMSRSNTSRESTSFQNYGVRIPLKFGVDLNVERNRMKAGMGERTVDSAMATMPMGSLRLLGRFNNARGTVQLLDPDFDPVQTQGRNFTFSAAYLGNSRMTLDYQASVNWNSGTMERWEQVASTFRLTARTQLQALTAFPDVMQTDRMQFRLLHTLRRDLALSIDYGPLSNFQPSTRPRADRGVMVMLRTQWSEPTPARGGELSGTVIDQTGKPVNGAVVRVGEYRAVADDKGRYVMRKIPPGHYTIALDPDSIPADQKPLGADRVLKFTSRSREKLDFKVIPLNAVTGRVWLDSNGNGKMDEDEGVMNIVIHLADQATATDRDGAFAFYNVEPGEHVVRLDTSRLPLGMAAVSAADVPLTLRPDGGAPKILFQLNHREKATIFETIP